MTGGKIPCLPGGVTNHAGHAAQSPIMSNPGEEKASPTDLEEVVVQFFDVRFEIYLTIGAALLAFQLCS